MVFYSVKYTPCTVTLYGFDFSSEKILGMRAEGRVKAPFSGVRVDLLHFIVYIPKDRQK